MDLDSGSESGSSAFPSSLFVGGLNLNVAAAWGVIVKSSDLGFGPAHKSGNAFGVALACFSYQHLHCHHHPLPGHDNRTCAGPSLRMAHLMCCPLSTGIILFSQCL